MDSAANNNFCVYCEKVVNCDSLERHIETCQYVLEPCKWKCGLYVPRNLKDQHRFKCQNYQDQISTLSATDQFSAHASQINLTNIVHIQQQQIQSLQQKLIESNNTIRNLKQQNASMAIWRGNFETQIDGINKELMDLKYVKEYVEASGHNIKDLIQQVERLKLRCSYYDVTITKIDSKLNLKEAQVQEHLTKQTKFINQLISEQKIFLKNNLRECTDHFKVQLEESLKQVNASFSKIKQQQISSQKFVEGNSGEIRRLKRSLAEVNLAIEMAACPSNNLEGLVCSNPGRLVWKIQDFNLNMTFSKENERVPIKSPVFYSKDYGYKLRLLVYLNGFKKWKGRHMLATLHVLKGDYDNLLKWPCKIEANVILRDCENKKEPQDFIRYVTAKRESPEDYADEPQESSVEYLFIPHKELLKDQYLKNDTIFLEVLVLK